MSPEERLRDLRDPDRWGSVRVPRPSGRAGGRATVAPARVGQLVAAFALAIAVVAGLVVGLVALHGTPPPAATTTPSSSTSGQPAKPATFSVVPGVKRVYSNSSVPSPCTLAQLKTASKQDGGGAAGTYVQSISVLNTGPDCLLVSDAIRVGEATASLASPTTPHGLVLPSLALARVAVVDAEACQPNGTKANIGSTQPVLPIVLSIGGRSRTMSARFPRYVCSAPSAEAYLDDDGSDALARTGFIANIDQPSTTPAGAIRYEVSITSTGADARVLTACPAATEVLSDGLGTVITRALTLQCALGAALEPDVPISLPVSTTIPSTGNWTIAWYLGGGSNTAAKASTCTLDQLHASEPGPGGASTGDWVQLITIDNRGPACTLPVTAFSVSGRVAHATDVSEAAGLVLPAESATHISVLTNTSCGSGSENSSTPGSKAKPIVLQLGGRDADGLDQLFPEVTCGGLFVSRVT